VNEQQARSTLSRMGWLSRMPADFREAVLALLVVRAHPPDTSFILAGDDGGGLWAVIHGQADLTSGNSTADSPPAHIGHAGSWWGPAPLFDRPRIASMTTRSEAILGQVPLPVMRQLLTMNPSWWRHIGDLVLDHADLAAGGLSDLLIPDSRRRCIAVMLRLCDCRRRDPDRPSPWGVTLPQEHLAEMANLSRQTVGPLLRDLATEELIELHYRGLTLRDPEKLRKIVDE
jgi:CRP-like cAMP-binding protein